MQGHTSTHTYTTGVKEILSMVQAYQVGGTVHIRQELIPTPLQIGVHPISYRGYIIISPGDNAAAADETQGITQGPNSYSLAVIRFKVTALWSIAAWLSIQHSFQYLGTFLCLSNCKSWGKFCPLSPFIKEIICGYYLWTLLCESPKLTLSFMRFTVS